MWTRLYNTIHAFIDVVEISYFWRVKLNKLYYYSYFRVWSLQWKKNYKQKLYYILENRYSSSTETFSRNGMSLKNIHIDSLSWFEYHLCRTFLIFLYWTRLNRTSPDSWRQNGHYSLVLNTVPNLLDSMRDMTAINGLLSWRSEENSCGDISLSLWWWACAAS